MSEFIFPIKNLSSFKVDSHLNLYSKNIVKYDKKIHHKYFLICDYKNNSIEHDVLDQAVSGVIYVRSNFESKIEFINSKTIIVDDLYVDNNLLNIILRVTKFKINLGGLYKNFVTAIPIDWKANKYNLKHWAHNFMSLRWLSAEQFDPLIILFILRDFYHYHCVKRNKNPYYDSLRGDHTISIRAHVFMDLYRFFYLSDDEYLRVPILGIINRLLDEELVNLTNPALYRQGHNHGLMIDQALIELYFFDKKYNSKIDIDSVVARSTNTVKFMFDESGMCREHSVSYQEYNLSLLHQHLKILNEKGISPPEVLSYIYKKCIDNSLVFLLLSIQDNGSYFPLGDTLQEVKTHIWNDIYQLNDIEEIKKLAFLQYEEGESLLTDTGFFLIKKTILNKRIHFGVTCGWNSHHHKQNDELSFCLNINGKPFFTDPGFSGFIQDSIDYNDEKLHSTVTLEDSKWNERTEKPQGSGVNFTKVDNESFEVLVSHNRISQRKIYRNFLFNKNTLKITDIISGDSANSQHLFVLSNEVTIQFSEKNEMILLNGDVSITLKSKNQPEVREVFLVSTDSRRLISSKAIVFLCNSVINEFSFVINT